MRNTTTAASRRPIADVSKMPEKERKLCSPRIWQSYLQYLLGYKAKVFPSFNTKMFNV